MNPEHQNKLWIGLIVAIVLGLIWQFYRLPNAEARMERLPLSGLGYKGTSEPLNEFETNFFKGVNIVKRIYRIGSTSYFVTILDGTLNRHVVHDPYYCFQGSGWSVISKSEMPIPGGVAALVNIKKDTVERQALFWYSNGVSRYFSPMHYWWATTLRRLTLGLSGAEPVMIMIQPQTTGPVDWNQFKENFPVIFDI